MSVSSTAAAPGQGRSAAPGRALFPNPLADLRVQYGIKLGLALVLALYAVQVLRLEYPNWAVLTVLVLMGSRYVGATGTKAFMRVLGTVGGALLAVWVVGDFANSPVIFVFWIFVFVVIATYKFGQVANSASPYAYWLVGLTLVSVSSYGISDPSLVWRFALYRTLETLVGVFSATFVNAVLWPRYARKEFLGMSDDALVIARQLLGAQAHAYLGDEVDPQRVGDLRARFSEQLVALRNLLQAGAQENRRFRQRLGSYQRFVVSLTHLFQAVLELQRRTAGENALLEHVRDELRAFLAEVDAELAVLSVSSVRHELPPTRLNDAYAALEARISTLRREAVFLRVEAAAVTGFFGHFATVRLIRNELNLLRTVAGELPRVHSPQVAPHRRRGVHLPSLDPFWLGQGIKGGLSVCLAFLLVVWLHPPGTSAIILGAWVFSVFGRNYLNAGGTGDLRVLQTAFLAVLLGWPVVAFCWVLMPLLSNYWAMNVFLFGVGCVYGYLTANITGLRFSMQLTLLSISAFVALNPQHPVAFATVVNAYLGTITGLAIAAVVARLIWPVLPQGVVRENLTRFFAALRNLLSAAGEPPESLLASTVLLPAEASRALPYVPFPHRFGGERVALANFVRLSQPLGLELLALRTSRELPIPAAVAEVLGTPLTEMERAFADSLSALSEAFRRRTPEVAFPDLAGPLAGLDAAVVAIRDRGLLAGEEVETVAHLLESVDRHHALAERLGNCRDAVRALHLDRYLGDFAL